MQLPILSTAGVHSTLLDDLPAPTEHDWRMLRPLPMSAEEAARDVPMIRPRYNRWVMEA